MNAINGALTTLFDGLLWPLELFGDGFALVVASGVAGVLMLIAFKHMSSQRGIRATKDKIKGHLIEVRLYQDDLPTVSKAIGKILGRNAQYVTYNFAPFVPLSIPFVLILAQLVVRYGFDPAPVHPAFEASLAGEGTTLRVRLAPGHEAEVAGLRVELPEGVEGKATVRVPGEGLAFREVAATEPGAHVLAVVLADGTREEVVLYAGVERPRRMQPVRASASGWYRLLDLDDCPVFWPAAPAFEADSPFRQITFEYPDSDLGWLPGGPGWVFGIFLLSAMAFGVAALKPLGIQI